MEQVASNAERDSIKYKQVEFMSDKIGKVYDGVISGVTEWGVYVVINENKCEGMIPIREMDDDFYELDEKNYRLVGRRKSGNIAWDSPFLLRWHGQIWTGNSLISSLPNVGFHTGAMNGSAFSCKTECHLEIGYTIAAVAREQRFPRFLQCSQQAVGYCLWRGVKTG